MLSGDGDRLRGDADGDLVGDACDRCSPSDPGRAPLLFGQTVLALGSKTELTWPTPLPYFWVRGDFTSAGQIGSYGYAAAGQGAGTALVDPAFPAAASGFWYLLRPDCPQGNWGSGGPAEQPGRDAALP